MWYSPNAASVSTVTATTGASTVALRVQEFSGVASVSPLEGSNGAAANGTTASSTQATATSPNDLAVGFIAGHSNTQTISVTSPGYTLQPQQTTSTPSKVSIETGYRVLPSTGAQSFAGSFPSGMYWSAGIALFKAGPTSPPPPDDFSMADNPTSATVVAETGTTSTISTAVTSGVAQSVALNASGAPTGTVVSFNPQTVTAGQSSTMTVTTATSTPVGPSTITVTGTGASAVHSASFGFAVTDPRLTTSHDRHTRPRPAWSRDGDHQHHQHHRDQRCGPVSGTHRHRSTIRHPGVVQPPTVSAGQSSTMTVTTAASTPVGPSTITVTGTGASAVHSASFGLTVTAPPPDDFSMADNPTSASVVAGSGTTSTISTTVTSGAAQSVALSATGAPTGTVVSFNPQTVTAGQSSTMTVTTSTSTPVGPSTITVTGTGASAIHSTSFGLTVTAVRPMTSPSLTIRPRPPWSQDGDHQHHLHRGDQRCGPVGGTQRHRSPNGRPGVVQSSDRHRRPELDYDRDDGHLDPGRALDDHGDRHRGVGRALDVLRPYRHRGDRFDASLRPIGKRDRDRSIDVPHRVVPPGHHGR